MSCYGSSLRSLITRKQALKACWQGGVNVGGYVEKTGQHDSQNCRSQRFAGLQGAVEQAEGLLREMVFVVPSWSHV